jgi:hypothetical protein
LSSGLSSGAASVIAAETEALDMLLMFAGSSA